MREFERDDRGSNILRKKGEMVVAGLRGCLLNGVSLEEGSKGCIEQA